MTIKLMKTAVFIALTAALSTPALVSAQGESEKDEALHLTPNVEHGKEVYEICSACHKPEGWGSPDGTFPQLSGQYRSVIIKQLADIRAKNRDNATMYPFSLPESLGGTQSIADVAEYIFRLPMTTDNGKGPGTNLELGKKLYMENCTRCHGENGEGNADQIYPRLQAQHFGYLVRQFKDIKDGKRHNANPEMAKQVQGFSEKDMMAVLDYASRLKPPADKIAPADWKNPDFK